MENKKRIRSCLLIAVGVLILALILFLGYRYMSLRVRASVSPPLVLIHNPLNDSEVYNGVGTPIHATARSESGVTRVELWVDGEYIAAEEASGDTATSPLVLHTFWMPLGPGTHEIIVKAIDANEVEGIGSVIVFASNPPEEVHEGVDPLEVSEETTEDTPVSDEPGGSEPAPSSGGDTDSSGGGSSAPPAGDPPAPPADDEEPPPSSNHSLEITFMEVLFGGLSLFDMSGGDETPAGEDGSNQLTLEVLQLSAGPLFETIHCYIGLGGGTPQWYPDTDLNPATDEYFQHLGFSFWNIEDYLGEGNGLVAGWPSTEPVPLSVNCIGTTDVGTRSVDLGIAEINAGPDEWDGVTRHAYARAEGSFEFAYRITQSDLTEKGLDPTIAVPFNLRINERRQELEWDWEGDTSAMEGGVNGFLVYVNDVLVFFVNGNMTRSVRIPYAWFNPPCRTEYSFTVRATKLPYPDGDYSEASEPVVLPGPGAPERSDCQPGFIVEFTNLHTGRLEPDGRPNNWAELVGPISASFFANGESTLFEGYDLRAHQTYNIGDLTWENPGISNLLVIEPTPGEEVTVGFDLGKYLGWDGFEDICRGVPVTYSYDDLMHYGYFEDTIHSVELDGTLCRVNYIIRPLEGSPLGGGAESMPLPWLDVVGIGSDPATGHILLDIKNRGSAPWVNHDLHISLVNREGEANRGTGVSDLVLEVGETKTIDTLYLYENPWEYCFILDSYNEVLELYENTGALDHTAMQYCVPKPDLNLYEVKYDFEHHVLRMRIWNTGEGRGTMGNSDINLADLLVKIDVPGDEDFISPIGIFGDRVLRQGEGTWVEWPLSAAARERLENGYTVILDPLDNFIETDEENNSITVASGTTIRVVWNGVNVRWYPDSILYECPNYGRWGANDYEVWIEVYAQSETSNRHMQSWHFEGETQGDTHKFIPRYGWDAERFTTDVYVRGEETLVVGVRGEQSGESMGIVRGYYEPERNWLVMSEIPESEYCGPEDELEGGDYIQISPSNRNWGFRCGAWYVYINRCEIVP